MNETRDDELTRLVREQATDDRAYQRPQRFGSEGPSGSGVETLSLDAYVDGGDHEDYVGGGLVQSAEEAYLASQEPEAEPFAEKVLAALTPEERDLYWRVFEEGQSIRQVEAETGKSKSSVAREVGRLRRRLETIAEEVLV